MTQGGGGATALLTLSGAGFIHKLSGSAPAIPPQEGETPRSSLSPLPPAKAPESWDIPYRSVGAEEPTRTPAPATRVFTGWAPPTERDLALIIPNEGRKLRPCTHPPPPGLPRVRPLLPRSRFPLTLQGDGGSWEGLPLCPSLSSWTELFISEQGCGRLCVACSALVPAPLCSSWNKGAPAPASPGGAGVGFGHRPQAAGRRVFLGEARPSGALTWGALEVRGTHCSCFRPGALKQARLATPLGLGGHGHASPRTWSATPRATVAAPELFAEPLLSPRGAAPLPQAGSGSLL